MYPVLAQLDVGVAILTIHAYGSFLVLAAAAAGLLFVRAAGSLGLTRGRASLLLLATLVAGLGGARLLDAAVNLPRYVADPALALSAEPRGFALYGGLVGAFVVAAIWSRRAGVPVRRLADVAIPAVAAGIVLLLFGRVTVPQAVHPTQLYELAAAVLLALAARLAARSRAAPGVPALVFATGFLAFRALNQAIRPTSVGAVLPAPALVAIYACAGLAASVLLVRACRAGAPPSLAPFLAA